MNLKLLWAGVHLVLFHIAWLSVSAQSEQSLSFPKSKAPDLVGAWLNAASEGQWVVNYSYGVALGEELEEFRKAVALGLEVESGGDPARVIDNKKWWKESHLEWLSGQMGDLSRLNNGERSRDIELLWSKGKYSVVSEGFAEIFDGATYMQPSQSLTQIDSKSWRNFPLLFSLFSGVPIDVDKGFAHGERLNFVSENLMELIVRAAAENSIEVGQDEEGRTQVSFSVKNREIRSVPSGKLAFHVEGAITLDERYAFMPTRIKLHRYREGSEPHAALTAVMEFSDPMELSPTFFLPRAIKIKMSDGLSSYFLDKTIRGIEKSDPSFDVERSYLLFSHMLEVKEIQSVSDDVVKKGLTYPIRPGDVVRDNQTNKTIEIGADILRAGERLGSKESSSSDR
ncbi:MAG: hypothetical protein HRU46_07885 [Verrucomicrobiales bacterium]|nr:hypothetical protein [Verrucomicrobiales bacterium]